MSDFEPLAAELLEKVLRAHRFLDNGYCRCSKDCLLTMDASRTWREHIASIAAPQLADLYRRCAVETVKATPFRCHAADDHDFHSGCVQTRDGIIAAFQVRPDSKG